MYFDALTLAAIVAELRATIVGGRVQRVFLPNALGVALEIYADHRRHHLLMSAHPRFARVHMSAARLSRGLEATTPLLLLLRKYVNRGWITAVEQPDLERVLVLSIAKRLSPRNLDDGDDDDGAIDEDPPIHGDSGEMLRSELVVEIMEQRSNIILVGDDNIILAAARHVTPRMSRRPVLPHEPYEYPPPQEKRDPREATAEGVRAAAEGQPDLARALVGVYRGMSPLAAREAVYRATGRLAVPYDPDLPWDAVADVVRGLWRGVWEPHLAVDETGPAVFAPYALTHVTRARPRANMSAALEEYYAAREQLTAHQQRRDALRERLNVARERLARQQSALQTELQRAADLDRLRWEGEMIYAFLHTLQPGQAQLMVEDRMITLDPRKSPVECAQERFRAYDKAKGALSGVPERLHAVELRLAGLDETMALLNLAEGYEAIEAIAREVMAEGYLGNDKRGRDQSRPLRIAPPLRVESSDGFTIYVGRSALQNEQVTFRLGMPDDLWLHVRGAPGAHVIVKTTGREAPERTILEAAALAAYYSGQRGADGVEVEIAHRRYVRKVRGGPAGLVTYQAERAVRIAPRPPW